MEQNEIFEEETIQEMYEQSHEHDNEKPDMVKCSICDDIFDKNDENINWIYTLKGEYCCEGCEENAWNYASRLYEFDPNYGIEVYHLDHNLGDLGNLGEGFPIPIKSTQWVNSGGYRGYTDWTLEEGYITVSDGWVTGMPDSTTNRKADLGEVFEQLKEDKFRPPIPLYWMFGVTSNIFSTSSSLIIKETDKEAFEAWMQEKFDYSIEDLQFMFE